MSQQDARSVGHAVVSEARSALAAGRTVDREALAARIRAGVPAGEADLVVAQLDRVLAIGRARTRLSRDPAPARTSRSLRTSVRTRPLLTANMDVRRESAEGGHQLSWAAAPGVVEWEVRIAERPSARGEYTARETRTLGGDATSIDVPIGDSALRIHLLGRGRDGRLLRRAVIAGLSLENWGERWQKRPSAS